MESPIRATIDVRPRLTFSIMRCDNSILPRTKSAIAKLSLASLVAHVAVPVQRRVNKVTTLTQETAPEWDRQLVVDHRLGCPSFTSPVLVSSRERWHIQGDTIDIFDRAVVIDGAKRLEAAFAYPSIGDIPVVIICGLTPRAEFSLRQQIEDGLTSPTRIVTRERVGTTAPRLSVGEDWVEVEVCSDPFVVPTFLGYSPAILVRRPAACHSEHLLIGAKSLATELESFRCKHGTLIGARIKTRKEGPKVTAPYLLRITNTPKG